MDKQTAINQIVTFGTLPDQIDYTEPYRIKAYRAEEFLKTLPAEEYTAIMKDIEEKVNSYWSSDVSYYDSLF